ncbi:MAG TPA: deoxyribodipyrimidine photolyase [Terriglobia bacterium]|nr:deoxyribodipyrimidine photolyase [Terriglobia bacterium]
MRSGSPSVPAARIRRINSGAVRGDHDYVLYWMTAYRRVRWNFALERAVAWAGELRVPLLIVEGLNCDYPWASDRIHAFVLEGMLENAAALDGLPVTYCPLIARGKTRDRRIDSFLERAAVVVTDDFPAFVIPRWTEIMASRSPALVESIDSSGLLPVRVASRVFETAHSFRRFVQQELPAHLGWAPVENVLAGAELPRLSRRDSDAIFAQESRAALGAGKPPLATLPIDHSVPPVEGTVGGSRAAGERLAAFLENGLPGYADHRNEIASSRASALSPYLHFGHISSHEIFNVLARRERWRPERLGPAKGGSRTGWWGMGSDSEAFLDQLVTWRELGFNRCAAGPGYDQYSSLPEWARKTLERHASDPREYVYSLDQFESAATHDPLWNAAQRELTEEGRIHNYLRMLWGKKILEWSATPQEALATMIHLNNKYALDGRDPNSYSGIFWILGRYDRPWGPERPIFGTVRYMSSANTARKLNVRAYLERYGREAA